MGSARLLTSSQFQLVQILQIVGSTLSLITVTAALSAHVNRTAPAKGPRQVMHQLVLVLFGFDLLFSLSLFAGPFVYNTNGGCQAIASVEVVFASSLIAWNLLIALYSLLMLKQVKKRKVLDNTYGVAVAAGVVMVLSLAQSLSLYTRGMLGRAVTNCWIMPPREQMYHFYVPLGLVWLAVTAISIRLLCFLARIPNPSQNTTAAIVSPMQRQAVAFSLCFLAVFLVPVIDRACILMGHRPPVHLLVLHTFFISLRGFCDAFTFSRFGAASAAKPSLPVPRRRLGPDYTSAYSERKLLDPSQATMSVSAKPRRSYGQGLRGLPMVTRLSEPQDKSSEEEGVEAGGLLPPSVSVGIFATTVRVPQGRVGDATMLPPPHEWLPSPSTSSYHTYVIAALTEGHDPGRGHSEEARQRGGEVKAEGDTWHDTPEGGPLPAESLHAIWSHLGRRDYAMWHCEAREGQARASLSVFVRACDVEAGEVVKMSHMASATHASPSRSSGREEDGTEGTDEAGGEACGVGVVVRYWNTCVAFICAACSAPTDGSRPSSPREGLEESWGLQEVLSQLDLTPSACLQTPQATGPGSRPRGGHVSNTYMTAHHTLLLLGNGQEGGGSGGPTKGRKPVRRRPTLPRFKLSLRSVADALRWFVTPQPLCGSCNCNLVRGSRQEEPPAMAFEAEGGRLHNFVAEGGVLVHSLVERQGQLHPTTPLTAATTKTAEGEGDTGDLEMGIVGQRYPEAVAPEGKGGVEWGRGLWRTAATPESEEGAVVRSTSLSLMLTSPIHCPLGLPCRLRLAHLHATWLDSPLPTSSPPSLAKTQVEQKGPSPRTATLKAASSQFSRRGTPGAMVGYALPSPSPSDQVAAPHTGSSSSSSSKAEDEEEGVDVAMVFPLPSENAALQASAPPRARQPPMGVVVWTPMGPRPHGPPTAEATCGKGGRRGAGVMELRTTCFPGLGLHALILVRGGNGRRTGQALVSLSGVLVSQVTGWVDVKHVPLVKGGSVVGFLDCLLQMHVQLDGSTRRALPVTPGAEVGSGGRGCVSEPGQQTGSAVTGLKAVDERKVMSWGGTQGEGGRVEREEGRNRDADKLQERGQSAGAAWGRAGDEKDREEMGWARASNVV